MRPRLINHRLNLARACGLKALSTHPYTGVVPKHKVAPVDLTSPEAVKRFRSAAKSFTVRATKSKQAAMAILVKEGIYTKKGKLTKNYS